MIIVEVAEYYTEEHRKAMDIFFKNLKGITCTVKGDTEDGSTVYVLENVSDDIKLLIDDMEDGDNFEILRR